MDPWGYLGIARDSYENLAGTPRDSLRIPWGFLGIPVGFPGIPVGALGIPRDF